MSKNNSKAITSFDDLVQSWTHRMMELDHKVTANRRSIAGLEKQIDETYQEMEDIEEAAHDLLGDKVHFNLYKNEGNAIRISYKSNSMSEPLVNIIKDRKIQTGKEPNKSELYFFTVDGGNLSDEKMASIIRMSEDEMEQTTIGKDGNYSSMEHGAIGTDEHGKPIQGIKMSVGNIASDVEPHTYHFRVRRPESSIEVSPDEIKLKGDTITFGKGVKLDRHEEQFQDLDERLSKLEDRFTTKVCTEPRDFNEEPVLSRNGLLADAISSDKSPVLSEEIDETTESTIGLVSSLDEAHLKKLYENLDGTYVYDMDDFHALVTQLFILQEAYKRKEDE